MKNTVKTLSICGLGLAMTVASIAPAAAFPRSAVAVSSQPVTEIQYRSDRDRFWDRDRDRREFRQDRRERRAYMRGHRGYRDHRPGYRRHSDGWWYPLAAFGATAVIGNAIANQPTVIGPAYSRDHVAWCSGRFKTYRSSDNTYIPSAGYRAQCNSPFN
jgi:hypothetical protein